MSENTMTITSQNKIYSRIVNNENIQKMLQQDERANISPYKQEAQRIKQDIEKMQKEGKYIPNKKIERNLYKNELFDKISSFDMHHSQGKLGYQINFTDKALDKMMNDKDFEKKVLGNIQNYMSQNYAGDKGGIVIVNVTDNIDEMKKEFIPSDAIKQEEKKKKGFWELRVERQRQRDEEYDKKLKKKKALQKRDKKRELIMENIQELAIQKAQYKIVLKEQINGSKILKCEKVENLHKKSIDARLSELDDILDALA